MSFSISPSFSLQHGQDLGAEDLFELLKVCLGEAIESPVSSKEPVCHDGMKVWMKPGVIAEGVDHHDHPRDAVIEARDGAEKHIEALFGTMAKLCQ